MSEEQLVDVAPPLTREDVVRVARSYLGVPWVHQGRNRDGIDCVGLLVLVARELGLSTFDMDDYERVPEGVELLEIMGSQMPQIHPHQRAGLGDVLVFHTNGVPTHVGIIGNYSRGGWSLIHAFNYARPEPRVVEHRLDNVLWMPRAVAAFSLLEMKR